MLGLQDKAGGSPCHVPTLEANHFPRMAKCGSPETVCWDSSSAGTSDFDLRGYVGVLLHETVAISSISFGREGQSQISWHRLSVLHLPKPSVVYLTLYAQEWLHFQGSSPWGLGSVEVQIAPLWPPGLQSAPDAPDAFLQTCSPSQVAVSSMCQSRGKVHWRFAAFMDKGTPGAFSALCPLIFYASHLLSCFQCISPSRLYPVSPLSSLLNTFPIFILAHTDKRQSHVSTFMPQSYQCHQNIISIVLSTS